jgi:RNA polymerase sigma-70 factor (ECF subfamily)
LTRYHPTQFGAALSRQLPALRRYAAALTGSLSLADDLVQDGMERALMRQDSLERPESLAAWLRSIIYHLYLDGVRKGRVFGAQVDVSDMEDTLAFSAPQPDRGLARDFLRAMAALSADQRRILLLVGMEGLSYREVAAELDIPVGTVMSRLARARAALRETMENGAPLRSREGARS